MHRKPGASAADSAALLDDDRLSRCTIDFVDDFPGVLIGAMESHGGDSEAPAPMNLPEEFYR